VAQLEQAHAVEARNSRCAGALADRIVDLIGGESTNDREIGQEGLEAKLLVGAWNPAPLRAAGSAEPR
jgi:hypothetical protein